MPKLVAVAAISDNNVISHNGKPPWNTIQKDKEQYKQLVDGHPLIFGENTYTKKKRNTYDIPILVMSFDPELPLHNEKHTLAISKREALQWINQQDKTVYVMGGGEIYRLFWSEFDKLVISHIPGQYQGDVFFPEIREQQWKIEQTQKYEHFTRKTYTRNK